MMTSSNRFLGLCRAREGFASKREAGEMLSGLKDLALLLDNIIESATNYVTAATAEDTSTAHKTMATDADLFLQSLLDFGMVREVQV